MKEFTLTKTGGKAILGVLGPDDLIDVLALQETVRASLPADKKMFVLPQTIGYFQKFLDRQTGVMIGVRAGTRLIAQMALMGPVDLREAIALHLITGNDVPFHHASLTEDIVVFKSMAADPAWRGNDLARNLVSFALEQAFVSTAAHVFLQASVGNKRSWNVFLRHGFHIVGAGYDPKDSQPRFIFQKPAFGFEFAPAIIADEVDPVEDFAGIVNLTRREALVGMYQEDSTDKFIFLRNRELLSLIPTVAKAETRG